MTVASRVISWVRPVSRLPTIWGALGSNTSITCKPAVPLLDVDAVSVFPERAGVELKELEVIGAR